MNRNKTLFICLAGATLVVAAARCSQEGQGGGGDTGTGGNSSTGNGGSSGTGAGNTTGTGNTGGSGTGTGNTTGTGTGNGGSGGSGGAVVTGTGGTGGRPDGGAGGGGGVSTGGTGGAGGVALTPAMIVPKLDGFLWLGTCAAGAPSTGNATDCPIYPPGVTTCPNVNAVDFNMRGAFMRDSIPVLGTPGTTYTINMEVRGVTGTRCYNGGTRVPPLSTDVEGSTGNDGWQVGGTPVDGRWNTWEFHVFNAATGGTQVGVYYLNAILPTSIYCERHETFVMKYTTSFPVPGGGRIDTVIHDSNCAGQQNCGAPDNQLTCGNPRTVSLVGMDPQPPASFTQPPITNTYHPQWLFFDVKSVTAN